MESARDWGTHSPIAIHRVPEIRLTDLDVLERSSRPDECKPLADQPLRTEFAA
jgi:hypothetical protein